MRWRSEAARAVRGLLRPQIVRAGALGLEAASSVVVARTTGLDVLGRYATGLVVATFLFLIVDGGQRDAVLRDLSRRPARDRHAAATRRRRRKATLVLVAGLAAWPVMGELGLGVGLLAAGLLLEQRWALLAGGHNAAAAATFLLRPSAVLLAAVAAAHASVLLLCVATFAAYATVHVADSRSARGLPGGEGEDPALSRSDSPYWLGAASLTAQVYVTGDYLLLAALAGAEEVGIYALAFRPTQAALALVGFLRDQWVRDRASGQFIERRAERALVARAGAGALALAGLLVVSGALSWLVGHPGRRIDVSAAVLLLSIPVIAWASLAHADLIAARGFRAAFWPVAAAAVLSLAGNAAVAGKLGAVGASFVNLLAEVTALILMLRARRLMPGADAPPAPT